MKDWLPPEDAFEAAMEFGKWELEVRTGTFKFIRVRNKNNQTTLCIREQLDKQIQNANTASQGHCDVCRMR